MSGEKEMQSGMMQSLGSSARMRVCVYVQAPPDKKPTVTAKVHTKYGYGYLELPT